MLHVNVTGDSYWRYNSNAHHDVNTDTYPKPPSRWDDIIQDLDDVLRIGDYVYFFRKGRYYRFNCITHLVSETDWVAAVKRECAYPLSHLSV